MRLNGEKMEIYTDCVSDFLLRRKESEISQMLSLGRVNLIWSKSILSVIYYNIWHWSKLYFFSFLLYNRRLRWAPVSQRLESKVSWVACFNSFISGVKARAVMWEKNQTECWLSHISSLVFLCHTSFLQTSTIKVMGMFHISGLAQFCFCWLYVGVCTESCVGVYCKWSTNEGT